MFRLDTDPKLSNLLFEPRTIARHYAVGSLLKDVLSMSIHIVATREVEAIIHFPLVI
jgi:hypothetical protein